MQSSAATVEEYIEQLPEDRKFPISSLREQILNNLPKGFSEGMGYGMIGYVIPHSIYPAGYHCDPKQALPFMGMASQKNFIAVYHMGIYASKPLMDWFTAAYAALSKAKLDMGKSCIRFKNAKLIPFELIGELASKMTAQQWIDCYEKELRR